MSFDLVGPAFAGAASPVNLDALGNFPILQFFGGLMILAAGLWIFTRGQKNKPDTPPPDAAHMFFDGPVVQALTTLREIRGSLHRIEQHRSAVAENVVRQAVETAAHARAVERNNELLAEHVAELRMSRRR